MSQNITIKEIAKEAGVSKSTVSRVLNDKPDVLPETKATVLAVMEKYNYQPNACAKGMSQKKNRSIGVVIPHDIDFIFKNQYYDEVLRGLLKVAKSRGYYVLLMCCQDMKDAVDAVSQKRVDGVMMLSPTLEHKKHLEDFIQTGTPVVTVGKAQFLPEIYQICTNNYKGASLAMEHLFQFGHQRIALINGPRFLPSSSERYKAYWDFMVQHDCQILPGLVREGANSIESGYQLMNEILDDVPDLTAVFVAADYMALGVIDAVQGRGLSIPKDISVMGFDNIPLSQQIVPKLSTVDQHIEEKGRIGMTVLLDLVDGIPIEAQNQEMQISHSIDIEATLCVRESTGRVSS